MSRYKVYECPPLVKENPPEVEVLVNSQKPKYCEPLRPLVLDYNITFQFAPGSNIQPQNFPAQGLASEFNLIIDSVSSGFVGTANLSRLPTYQDLDGSTIKVPIPGIRGSTNSKFDALTPEECQSGLILNQGNVEIYFFAEGGKYIAVLEGQFLTTGNMITCRIKSFKNELTSTNPVPLLFNAVLRYLKQPSNKHMPKSMDLANVYQQ
jgi:hypothetical protein